MSDTPSPRRRSTAVLTRRALPQRLPSWAVIVFSIGFTFAMSPNLLHVFGIHNDYEMLVFKNHGLLFHEAERLFLIARPVAALLCNLTLLPVDSIAEFRFTRLFSVATVCFLGFQMMSICVHRLRIDVLPAVVIALTTFLAPAFIYSVLNAPAWGIQLLPVLIAFLAYEMLSNSNVQAIPFLAVVESRNPRAIWRQLLAYCALRPVWGACLVLQIAFYDFPPNALVIAALPVAGMLLSRAPARYRALIAVRDIGFIVANLVIYIVSVKAVYLPFIGLLTNRNGELLHSVSFSKFNERLATSYSYKFNVDPAAILDRLRDIGRVSGDLWFLPQAHAHVAVGVLVLLAAVLLVGRWLLAGANDWAAARFGSLALAVTIVCFLLANAAVLGADGGFVEYRTVVVSTMIVVVVLVFAVESLARMIGTAIGRSRAVGAAVASAGLLVTAGAAVAGNFDMNYLTMKLARNETAYFEGIVRQAIHNQSRAVIIIDPRPFSLPEDHREVYDEGGHAIPPFILSCFSGVCMQNGAIVTILAEQFGIPRSRLEVFSIRGGDPIPNATCEMLTDPALSFPAGATEGAIQAIKYLRGFGAITCVTYSLAWHNVASVP